MDWSRCGRAFVQMELDSLRLVRGSWPSFDRQYYEDAEQLYLEGQGRKLRSQVRRADLAGAAAAPPRAVTSRSRDRCKAAVRRTACTATPAWRARSSTRRRSAWLKGS